MTDIDVSQIKVGDTAGLEVMDVDVDGTVRLKGACWVKASAIVSHTPAPRPALKVGDRVKNPIAKSTRTIIWIEHDCVWFKPIGADAAIYPHTLSDVETWERLS